MDSGTTNHMTGSKELVTELRPNTSNASVSCGDNSSSKVLGFGKVVITPDLSLVNVMLVETLGYNLLSVHQLATLGFSSFFDIDMVALMWSKTLKVAYVGYVENGLYVVDFSKGTTTSATCLVAKADVGWLWHRRLAHVNMRALQNLLTGGHIRGLTGVKFAKDRVCRACIEGKMHDTSHPSKTIISSKRCLELLHMDLFGPPSYASLGGKKYCLVIVDDYSRYTWVYFFKHKSETQEVVIEFANEVQRQHNEKILYIRSDNGSEFKNYTLNEFLGEEGIRHQYSAAYTPQQNGVAERKNRTLIDAARTMMAEFKSPYNFWAEAISTACHATNRLYLRKGLNKTPYEILTGNKPDIKYFHVFGCKCYILKKGMRLSKFESKVDEGIFVGYSANSHAYRVYNKTTGIVVESCNVQFDEDNGSQVGQSGVCDVDDEMPPDVIRRMGVGFYRPIEEPLVTEGEGPCSSHEGPSSSQDHLAPHGQANNEDNQDSPSSEHGNDQEQANVDDDPPHVDQGHDQDDEHLHDSTHAHQASQGEDRNLYNDDQVVSQESIEEAQTRRDKRFADILHRHSITLENVLGSVRSKVSTRCQLANFSAHHAFISNL